MEGRWIVRLGNETHTVRAHLSFSLIQRLTVHYDDEMVDRCLRPLALGELLRFQRAGSEFVIRVSGYGHLGHLALRVDGRDVAAAAAPAAPAEPARTDPAEPDARHPASVVETERITEPLGDEVREIDNSRSDSQVQRRITVSREWSQTCTVEYESAKSIGGSAGFQLPALGELRASAETALTERYSIATGVRRTYTDEVTVTVPAKTKVSVIFGWKQVWQCGMVVVRRGNGHDLQLPYRIRLEPTFDQRQIDRPD